MQPSFEEQKQELQKRLEIEYALQEWPWWKGDPPEYLSTELVANTPPYVNASARKNSYKRNGYEDILIVAIMLAWITIAFFIVPKTAGILMGIFGLFIFTKLFLFMIDRKEKLKIDESGIWRATSGKYVAWNNIVATYIRTERRSRTTSIDLVVHYYNEFRRAMESYKIDIAVLDSDHQTIAFTIEYYKLTSLTTPA